MPVTIKVNGTANSLVHKGSNGISAATMPDVCKTPSPGGPVPMPYPNVSQSATLNKGTSTIKADGMMAAIKGSEFSLSNGDNAGVAGGVKSSTFMKESTWILYSFDVKMDGQNACRLTDKKFQNHENTVDLGGTAQPMVTVAGIEITKIACDCMRTETYEKAQKQVDGINASRAKKGKPPLDDWLTCAILGSKRHKCVSKEIERQGGPGKGVHTKGGANYQSGKMPMRPKEPGKKRRRRQAHCRPDIIITQPGVQPPIPAPEMEQIIDLKFQCNKDDTIKPASEWDPDKALGKDQRECYENIKLKGGEQHPEGVEVKSVAPTQENCN